MVLNNLIIFLIANLKFAINYITGVSVPAVSRKTIEFSVFKSFGYKAERPTVETEYPRGKFLLLNLDARKVFPLL